MQSLPKRGGMASLAPGAHVPVVTADCWMKVSKLAVIGMKYAVNDNKTCRQLADCKIHGFKYTSLVQLIASTGLGKHHGHTVTSCERCTQNNGSPMGTPNPCLSSYFLRKVCLPVCSCLEEG